MKYVIDSCTAFKWFLAEQESDDARVVRDSFRNQLDDSVLHVLSKRLLTIAGAKNATRRSKLICRRHCVNRALVITDFQLLHHSGPCTIAREVTRNLYCGLGILTLSRLKQCLESFHAPD